MHFKKDSLEGSDPETSFVTPHFNLNLVEMLNYLVAFCRYKIQFDYYFRLMVMNYTGITIDFHSLLVKIRRILDNNMRLMIIVSTK